MTQARIGKLGKGMALAAASALLVGGAALTQGAVAAPGSSINAPQVAAGEWEGDVTAATWAAFMERSQKQVVILEASTTWCGYCKLKDPLMKKLNQEGAGKWFLGHIDGDKDKPKMRELKVRGYPTSIAFYQGQEIGRDEGWDGEANTKKWVDAMIAKGPQVAPAPQPPAPPAPPAVN